MRYDDPGNINFGYVGAVLFPKEILCFGAGVNQVWKWGFTLVKKEYISNLIYGALGGLVLFLIGMLQSLLPFLTIDFEVSYLATRISFYGIVLIAVCFLVRKKSTILSIFIRAVTMIITYICIFVTTAQIGAFRSLYNWISKDAGVGANNTSGLVWVVSFFTVVCACVATLSIKALVFGIVKLYNAWRKKTKKTREQGDDSMYSNTDNCSSCKE